MAFATHVAMDNRVLVQYQIPQFLFKAALKPIGTLAVRLGGFDIATTSVNQFGVATFHVPPDLNHKIVSQEYVVRTLLYHPGEGHGGDRKDVKIVCLTIVRALRSEY